MNLTSLDKAISTQFPEYATLMSREPKPGAEVQNLLGNNEAFLTFIRSWKGDKTHVFVVHADGIQAYTVPVSLEEIKDAVAEIRAGLDLSNVRSLSEVSSFDTTLAFELYEKQYNQQRRCCRGLSTCSWNRPGRCKVYPWAFSLPVSPRSQLNLPITGMFNSTAQPGHDVGFCLHHKRSAGRSISSDLEGAAVDGQPFTVAVAGDVGLPAVIASGVTYCLALPKADEIVIAGRRRRNR